MKSSVLYDDNRTVQIIHTPPGAGRGPLGTIRIPVRKEVGIELPPRLVS